MGGTKSPQELLDALIVAGRLAPEAGEAWRARGGRAAELPAFLRERLPETPGRDAILAAFAAALDGELEADPVAALRAAEAIGAADRNRRLRLAAVAFVAAAAGLWCWEAGRRAAESERERTVSDLARRAAACEEAGDLRGALGHWQAVLHFDPDRADAVAGRSRARDTLRFAGAMADMLAALDAGAREVAAGHARVAESLWPGHPVVREAMAQAEGLARLRVETASPCTLLVRPCAGGEARRQSCPEAAEWRLPAGEYELVAAAESSALRRMTVRLAPDGEVRLSLLRVPVTPAADGSGLQRALDQALPGTTLVLAPGTYRESVRLRTDHVRIEAQEPATAVLQAPAADVPCLRIEAAREIELSGLVLEGGSAGVIADPGRGLHLYACVARRNQVGVLLVDRSEVRIERCELVENREAGLYGRASSLRVLNGRFADNRGSGLCLDGAEDVLVASNVFAGNRRAGVVVRRGAGAVEVRDNVIHGSARGIVADAAPCWIRHNTVSDFREAGIEAAHRGDRGELEVVDNVIAFGAGVGLHLREEEAMGAALACDHNALAGLTTVAQWTTGRRTESFATLDEWRRRTDLDRSSMDADPAFEAAAGASRGRLSPGSPCRGAGSDGQDLGARFDGDRPRETPTEPPTLPEWAGNARSEGR